MFRVDLHATNERALVEVELEDLQKFAVDAKDAEMADGPGGSVGDGST